MVECSEKRMKIIVDTSVVIRAILTPHMTYGRQTILFLREENVSYFLNEEIWQELITTLQKPHIAKRLQGFEKPVSDFLKWYQRHAIWIKPSRKIKLSRDIKDNVFLEIAFCVKADYLISYDEDLLILKKIGNTKIIEPKEFFQQAN
jgi:putative PIN family toxin of toxin-antitoxin system